MAKQKSTINLKDNLTDQYVAFIDVMGFSHLVNTGKVEPLETYFTRITEVLDKLRQQKADIRSFLISDSIILIAPDSPDGLKNLVIAIRRIQSALLSKKILLRGAISFGQVFYDGPLNIVVGKGFIRAYQLESEANYPRVIIDPSIVTKFGDDKTDFLERVNGSVWNPKERLIYKTAALAHSKLQDDAIFIDYAPRVIYEQLLSVGLKKVYELIRENLYGDQKLYSKYIWLRDYFIEHLVLAELEPPGKTKVEKVTKVKLGVWRKKFMRL